MSKETFSIPVGPSARYDFQHNVIALCVKNGTAWGLVPTTISNLQTLQSDYESKYAITANRNTQSPAATADREAAWKPLEKALDSLFTHDLLNNDAISAADKEALHIHLTAGGGASSPAPTTAPIISLTAEEVSSLHVVYSDSSAPGTHYKPDNVAFCEICYKADAPAPVTPAECNEHINISRSHDPIVFRPELRGKTIYAYGRWVNRNGKTGPWSGQITGIVP